MIASAAKSLFLSEQPLTLLRHSLDGISEQGRKLEAEKEELRSRYRLGMHCDSKTLTH